RPGQLAPPPAEGAAGGRPRPLPGRPTPLGGEGDQRRPAARAGGLPEHDAAGGSRPPPGRPPGARGPADMTVNFTTPTPSPKVEDGMPLVFLASVAPPDAAFRAGIARSLDSFIQGHLPLHTEDDVRQLLKAQKGTHLEPFVLDPMVLPLAVRYLRWAFS